MADDNNSRYRSNDPLAELARLIGQSDPFADFGNEQKTPVARDIDAPSNVSSSPQDYDHTSRAAGNPPFRFLDEPEQHYNAPPRSYENELAPRFDSSEERGFDSDRLPRHDDNSPRYGSESRPARHESDWPEPPQWLGDPGPAPSYRPSDPFAAAVQPRDFDQLGEIYREHDAHFRTGRDAGELENSPSGVEDLRRTAAEPAIEPSSYPYEAGADLPLPDDDEAYGDEPRGNQRKGLFTVAAVLGLAVIGTAGAFGYRHYFGGSAASPPPPVIRASTAPNKVAPPPSASDPAATKFSYDRFGDRGKDEQVVTRQETPIDPKVFSQSGAPPLAQQVVPGARLLGPSPPSAGGAALGKAPSALGEPRRVRVVPIRPGEPDAAATPQTVSPPKPETRVAAVPQPAEPPVRVEVPQTVPAARRSAPAPRRPAAVEPPAERVANAPLSLSPNSSNLPSPPRAPQAMERPKRAAAPTRLASAPSGGRGHYLVQVASRKSEADAAASLRSIQAKYSSVLGGQPHVVRRADLGSRGVYYRAMVGPFGTREQAAKLCSSLKAAGGDCIVQSN
jgi:hypothetical protein